MPTVILFSYETRPGTAPSTALVTAERFAASYWADRRSVRNPVVTLGQPDSLDFQVSGGHGTWYRASPKEDGWQVAMILSPQDPL